MSKLTFASSRRYLFHAGNLWSSYPWFILYCDSMTRLIKASCNTIQAPSRNALKQRSREATPDGLRSRSSSSNGWERSFFPASTVPSSHLKFSDNHSVSSPTPVARKLFTGSSPYQGAWKIIDFLLKLFSLKSSFLLFQEYAYTFVMLFLGLQNLNRI